MNLGDGIRHLGYETRVLNGATCDSGCALIWFAGKYRYLDPRVRIGVHSEGWVDGPLSGVSRWEEANALIAKWLASRDM